MVKTNGGRAGDGVTVLLETTTTARANFRPEVNNNDMRVTIPMVGAASLDPFEIIHLDVSMFEKKGWGTHIIHTHLP
jgi:hypothetical protein